MPTITSKKMYRTFEKHTSSSQKSTQIVGGDFNAELGPGYGVERTSVGPHTHGGNKIGDWLKHWLMIQHSTALNTICRKTPGKQTTYRSSKGTEKQIDCILIKRRHLKYNKDAEANAMIHIGIDHRCVMATFVINTPKKDGPHDANKDKLRTTEQNIRTQTDKTNEEEEESSMFEKSYRELMERIKEKAEAANSDLKQNKEKPLRRQMPKEKKKNEKKAVAQSRKSGSSSGYKRNR